MTRSAQFELTFEGDPRPVIVRLRPVLVPDRRTSDGDPRASRLPAPESRGETARAVMVEWAGARDGVREVLLTLMATLAIGFGWAAIEAGRANVALVEAGAPASGTGYAGDARWEP